MHRIDDTDGAVANTIDAAIAGRDAGDVVTLPVSSDTPVVGETCEVYDLNGRWVKLHLSDGSAPDYNDSQTLKGNGSVTLLEKLIYNAAHSGQTMTITLTKTDSDPPPSIDIAAARIL
jgi:hypothetical protein